MEMDPAEAQTLPRNGLILRIRARAGAGIFCCVPAVLQLWVWTESLPDLVGLLLTCLEQRCTRPQKCDSLLRLHLSSFSIWNQ